MTVTLLGPDGRPLERIEKRSSPEDAYLALARANRVKATYDGARTSTEFENYWVNADRFDADSAHSKEVRHTLVSRQRYECANNGFADGIAQTYATDLVGIGPALRMQTSSQPFNQLVERTFQLWSLDIQLRRKLWCMAHAKGVDGESFGIMRINRRIAHPIQLDVCLYETEQCQTPFIPFGEPGYIDGIKFDQFGNPLWYDFLHEHPGANNRIQFDMTAEKVPAERVLHWFKMRRPGQHRGVPESASTLNTGAAARRWREATLAAAETAADINVMMTTQLTPDSTTDPAAPFSTIPIQKRMLTMAPMGWDATHFKSEHPNASHEAFHKSLVNEQARPKNMPFNKAACDSSDYNYASGRLDHQTYYAYLDVDREDCNDSVLVPLFLTWFGLAVSRFGWLGGNPDNITSVSRLHTWDWPKHRVADVEAEANANDTKLKSGQISIPQLKTDGGVDPEDAAEQEAAYYGITVQELKRRQLDAIYPPAKSPAENPAAPSDSQVSAAFRNLVRRGQLSTNGNGHHG